VFQQRNFYQSKIKLKLLPLKVEELPGTTPFHKETTVGKDDTRAGKTQTSPSFHPGTDRLRSRGISRAEAATDTQASCIPEKRDVV